MKSGKYLIFASMGFELVGLIVGGVYLGQILDKEFGTKGLLLMSITIVSLIGWFIHLLFLLKRMEKLDEKE